MRKFLLFPLSFALLVAPVSAAQEHVVSPSDLTAKVVEAARARRENTAKLRRFFVTGPAATALTKAGIAPAKVERGIALLDDQELARLAARAEKARDDFAGGALTNQQLTYIVISLATAVIILVIVAA